MGSPRTRSVSRQRQRGLGNSVRAVIVSGGPLLASPAFRQLLRQADLVFCADGGLQQVRKYNVIPDAVIGDLDSADPKTLKWARRHGILVRQFRREKDKTDTELALDYAIEQRATEVDFLGVLGGRIDHSLGNVFLLARAESRGLRARLLDERTQVMVVTRAIQLEAASGDLVSLIALTETVRGVTTQGLRYPLTRGVLRRGSTLGVSNEVTVRPASVRIGSGLLLVIVTRHGRAGRQVRVRGSRR